MKISRAHIRLGLTFVRATLFALSVPSFTDRRDYAAAVNAYLKNPTSENAVLLAREHAKNRRQTLVTRVGIGAALFVLMNLGWMFVFRGRRS